MDKISEALQAVAPGLYAVMSAHARIMFGKSIDSLSFEELQYLVATLFPNKIDILNKIIEKFKNNFNNFMEIMRFHVGEEGILSRLPSPFM
jgi:hypothetical protein